MTLIHRSAAAAFAGFALFATVCRGAEPAADKESAAKKSAAELLPVGTVAYVEIPRPKELLATILDHPLRAKLEETSAYRKAISSPQFFQLAAVVSLVETQIGMKWRAALEAITGEGVFVALDGRWQGAGPGVVLLVKSSDAAVRDKLQETLVNFARGDTRRQRRRSPLLTETYHNVTIHQVGQGHFTSVGPWFLATNQGALGKEMIDRCLGDAGKGKTLADDGDFKAARSAANGNPTVWGFVRVPALRETEGGKKLLVGKSNEPGAEAVFGGVLATLAKTTYVTAALAVEPKGLKLSVAAPHDPAWVPAARQYYFGPAGNGTAPPLLAPKNTLVSLAAYRDIGGMWQSAAELFDENANAKLAQADSGLSNLFGGRDFSQDVLGAFGPQWQLVAARQDYTKTGMPEPTLKLPAFALGARLKDAAQMQEDLAVSFQSIVGFFNIAGSQERYPRLKINTQKRDGGMLITTDYLLDKERGKDQQLFYNFSPSLALVGDRLFLASTKQLAEELFEAHRRGGKQSSAGDTVQNARVELDAQILAEVLTDNRAQFVSQNMLKKGQNKAQAEQEIDMLLSLLRWVKSSSLKLEREKNTLRFDLGISLN